MEIRKSVVKQAQPNGTWEGKFGVMYKHEIEMENGDVGEYSSKSKEQTKFVEGNEVEYEYHPHDSFPKIKPHSTFQPGGNGFFKGGTPQNTGEIQDKIVKQTSMKCATELACAYIDKGQEVTIDDIKEMATELAEWVNNQVVPKNHYPKKKEHIEQPF